MIQIYKTERAEIAESDAFKQLGKADGKISIESFLKPKAEASSKYAGAVLWSIKFPLKIGDKTTDISVRVRSPLFRDENGEAHIRMSTRGSRSGVDQARQVKQVDPNTGREVTRYYNDITSDNVILAYVDHLAHERYKDELEPFITEPTATAEVTETEVDSSVDPEL